LELAAAGTIEELEQGHFKNKIILLHGEIAKEQIALRILYFGIRICINASCGRWSRAALERHLCHRDKLGHNGW
jgi:hypothetical protein